MRSSRIIIIGFLEKSNLISQGKQIEDMKHRNFGGVHQGFLRNYISKQFL